MDAEPLKPKMRVAKSAVVRAVGLDGISFHPRSYAG
jgi:hypothetical protein